MSLNGLDDATIREAHEAAVAEPGGWFLLKYASRDELEIIGRGNGGIVEIRNNIAQFDEKAPLYGFLRYRRRNVIIRYLPDDCSRLVQARVSVHFNTICDRFAPYDTAFEITNAKELKDTKLSAACSLHAASGSTSSSTSSLRRRRLMEITEEEEEEERERKRQSIVKEEDSLVGKEDAAPGSPTALSPKVTLNSELASSAEATQFSTSRVPPEFSGIARPPSPAKSFDDAARRASSQTARPDLYSYSSYPYSKAKVKLAPRPSLDVSGRPNTSSSAGPYRPISALPAGFKFFSKKGKSQDKSGSSTAPSIKEEAEMSFPSSLSIPENRPLDGELTRPHTSSGAHGAVGSLFGSDVPALPPALPTVTKKNTITPEKARLMKAMKLREKKMMGTTAVSDAPTVENPSELLTADLESEETIPETEPTEEVLSKSDAHLDTRFSISKADSGIGIDVSNDQASVDTHIDSHPASPIAASSDIGESTQASSLSESTDETVHPSGEQKSSESENEDEVEDEDEQVQQPEVALSAVDSQHHEQLAAPAGDLSSEPEEEVKQELDQEPEQKLEQEPKEDLSLAAKQEPDTEPESLERFPEFETQPMLEPIITDTRQEGPVARSPILPVSKFSTASPRAIEMPQERSEEAITKEETTVDADEGEESELPQSPQLHIPLSKFSTREAKSPTSPSLQDIPSVLAPTLATSPVLVEGSTPPETDGELDEAAETGSIENKRSRRKFIEPIRTDLEIPADRAVSDANLSDDDDLMDELQSATVEQAHSMMVSKSPIMPVFPANSPPKRATTGLDSAPSTPYGMVRTVSNPVRGGFLAPGDVSTSSARSVSSGAAFLHKITQQPSSSDLRPKSSKIGSSISQRIKALERLSSIPGAEGEKKERPSSTFFSVRKPSTREPSRSPSVVDRAHSISRVNTPSPDNSRESSPEASKFRRDRSGSMASRLSLFEGGNLPRGRPESVQVTARIIREPGQSFPKMPEFKAEATDYGPLDLKQSPLVVDHQKATPGTTPAPTPVPEVQQPKAEGTVERRPSLLQRRFSKGRRSQSEDREAAKEASNDDSEEPRPRRRSSLTIVKDFIKDRRTSILSAKSVSTDNLNLTINPAPTLASPALGTPSKSPSRPPSVHHNSLFPRRLSVGSRRSSLDQKSPGLVTGFSADGLSPSLMTEASGESEGEGRAPGSASGSNPGSSVASPSTSSKGNRATRFMRRLSNSLNSNRKTVTPSISPTVAEEDDAEVEAAGQGIPPSRGSNMTSYMQPTIVSYMGDVNVQFPDTLLWKRRTMCLDSQGFLILSAIQGVTATMPAATAASGKDRLHQAGAIKRYHMSDFRPPYVPEIEVQELPNSVLLDFIDGSGIQIACEDRAGQMNTLHVLEDAHQNHTSFGL